MKLLVVGGSSFIGRNLLPKIPKQVEVFSTYYSNEAAPGNSVKADLRNPDSIAELARKLPEVDVILYLAANSDPKKSIAEPLNDLELNALGLVRVLKSIRCRRLVYMSTGAVYQDELIPYVISKRTAEEYVKYFARAKGFSYVIVRLFDTYGPYSPERKIFRKLARQFSEGKAEVTLFGDGSNLIDPLYVGDTADALVKVIMSSGGDATADLCTGKPITLKELVERTGQIFGVKPKIRFEGEAVEKKTYSGDPSRMKELFGFSATVSLEGGFKRWQATEKL